MNYISTMKDTKDLSITIYNNNFGVIKEKRVVDLNKAINQIQYLDVAQLIETDSIIVDGVEVIELNYDYDLVSKEKLMEKYLDNTVILYDKEHNIKEEYRLLSVKGGLVLEKMNTKEIVINPEGQIILPKLPGELIVKPALIWKVRPSEQKQLKVSYITKGLSWTSNYVVYLKKEDFNLSGWVSIENNSGTTFEEAKLKLIAGDVKKEEKDLRLYEEDIVYSSSPAALNFAEESFFDYHMYSLQHKTNLKTNQSKQIKFINAEEVKYVKYYDFTNYGNRAKVIIEFENKMCNGLGIPLPEGTIKVYKEDYKDGNLEFIGEDFISHTPKDEKITLHIGDAFDVLCDKKRIDFKRTAGYEYHEYEYNIRNHKDEDIKTKFNHYISEDWELVESSEEIIKESSSELVFWIKVKANEEKKIRFKYKVNKKVSVEVNK